MKSILILVSIMIVGFIEPLMAQDGTMADLRAVVVKLKDLKSYSYQTEKSAVFPNGQKDNQITTVYMDAVNKRLCYKNNAQILLLTDKWAYKADHRTKNVSVFNVVKYNDRYKQTLPELEAVFKNNLAAAFMDSVVLKEGKLRSAKRQGGLTTFIVGFPADSYLEQMSIVYDHARQLPESITIRSFYPGDASSSKAKGTTVVTVSSKYNTQVNEQDFATSQYFQVSGAKVQLAKFKNYKVTSIL